MKQLNLFSSEEESVEDPFIDNWSLETELEHKILYGLSCEWTIANDLLDAPYQQQMRRPLFLIKAMKSRLGYWSAKKSEICLSRNLVMNHPWDAVREVLLHEMAHQMADQVLGCTREAPHGPGFNRACRLLRANPKASGNYPTLDDRISNQTDSTSDSQLRRIKKLMALAKSQNRNEAQAAMLKAHKLIKKYNIDIIHQNEDRQFATIFLGKPSLRHTRDHYHLALLLQHFYFVQGIWVSAFVMEKERMGRVLEVSGTPPNIKMASYVYHFVRRFIQSQWESYNKTKGHTYHRKIDFSVGIIEGFRSKLEINIKNTSSANGNKAIVKVEDSQLKKYMAYKYPNTRSFSRNSHSQDEGVLKDGISIGKKLVISKGISDKEKSNRMIPQLKK